MRAPPLASRNSAFRIRAAVTPSGRLVASEARFRPRSQAASVGSSRALRVSDRARKTACQLARGFRPRKSRQLHHGHRCHNAGACAAHVPAHARTAIGCCACAPPVADGSHSGGAQRVHASPPRSGACTATGSDGQRAERCVSPRARSRQLGRELREHACREIDRHARRREFPAGSRRKSGPPEFVGN